MFAAVLDIPKIIRTKSAISLTFQFLYPEVDKLSITSQLLDPRRNR